VRRYERSRPGGLVHIAVKKPGRVPDERPQGPRRNPNKNCRGGSGYACLHTALDDHTRLAAPKTCLTRRPPPATRRLVRRPRHHRRAGPDRQRPRPAPRTPAWRLPQAGLRKKRARRDEPGIQAGAQAVTGRPDHQDPPGGRRARACRRRSCSRPATSTTAPPSRSPSA